MSDTQKCNLETIKSLRKTLKINKFQIEKLKNKNRNLSLELNRYKFKTNENNKRKFN